jgi:hypothetical protein
MNQESPPVHYSVGAWQKLRVCTTPKAELGLEKWPVCHSSGEVNATSPVRPVQGTLVSTSDSGGGRVKDLPGVLLRGIGRTALDLPPVKQTDTANQF